MHEIQDLPLEEIGVVLGIPVGTVKSRLHRGRVALGRVLGPGLLGEPQAARTPSKPPTR